MTVESLNKLIEEGEGNFGTYVTAGAAVSVIKLPPDMCLAITNITLHAFADLAAGRDFTVITEVVPRTWHQLTVRGYLGANIFQARHEVRSFVSGATTYYLPQGKTDWNVFLNHEGDIVLELLSLGGAFAAAAQTSGSLPVAMNKFRYPQPPGGYGVAGAATSLTSVETLTVGNWQFRPFNTYTPANPPNIDSRSQFIMRANAATRLNLPLPAITFGHLTFPIIEITGVLYRKKKTLSFSRPVTL